MQWFLRPISFQKMDGQFCVQLYIHAVSMKLNFYFWPFLLPFSFPSRLLTMTVLSLTMYLNYDANSTSTGTAE